MDIKQWPAVAQEFNETMGSPGAFLTTASDGLVNTMTMGWGSAGYFWVRPIVTVPVRLTRYTREFIEKTGVFTISIPRKGELHKELAYVGTKSGRDGDKLAACGLTAVPGRTVPVPVIGQACLHLECRVLYTNDISRHNLDAAVDSRFYTDRDYHTLYMAEVLDFYEL